MKSIHVIFIRTGAYSAGPMELELEQMHAGRAWASDTITAYQGDRLLSRGLVLLNAIEPDLIRHGPAMPDLPGPDDSIPIERPVLFPGIEARRSGSHRSRDGRWHAHEIPLATDAGRVRLN